ncbi:hypothetical protein BD414DRAFT_420570 [Trametes punicea]|nr:hypothetical protein BD414DRAFT_420570 [Trametes punicea]
MLLRTAGHAVPPAIALDFLIPRTVLRRNFSESAHLSSELFHTTGFGRRSRPLSSLPSAASPSSSRSLTPGAVLQQLDRDVGTFDEQTLATTTNAQIETFNSSIPELSSALAKRDTQRVSELWATLKNSKLFTFFGPHHHDICSRGVSDYFAKRSHSDRFPEHEERLLRDIALVAAAGGCTDGLRTLMFREIKMRRPDAALALYEEYLEALREKGVLRRDESEEAEEERPEEVASSDDAPPALSPIRDEILLAAIVAYAQKNSFADALKVYLKAATRVSPSTVEEFTQLLRFDHALSAKMNLYARRLNAAALLARPPTLMKHLTNLTQDSAHVPLERLYSTAIAGATDPDPWLALTRQQLSGTRVVLLPDFFWPSFIRSFLACRRTDLAERLWDDMVKLGVKPDIVAWNAFLDGYGQMRSLPAVLKMWEIMNAQRVKPDALSHRALISAHFAANQPEGALQRFHQFERDYLTRGVSLEDSAVLAVYNTMLHGLLFVSREEDALAIKTKMETKGPKPDVVTYNTFMRYYGRKGNLRAMAGILQQLEPAGVKADVYTFSTLLSAMLKVRADAGEIVMNFMKKQGVVPDTTALTAIINNQLQDRTPQSFKVAMDLLSKMERGEFGDARPNAITYTSVLTAINRGMWLERSVVEEYNRRIWETMRSRDLQPNRTTYNVLLKASLDNPEPEGLENAMRYYRDMTLHGAHMGTDTWYILLKGLMDREQWDVAREVVEDMRGYKLNNITGSLRTLMNRLGRRNGSGDAAAAAAYR